MTVAFKDTGFLTLKEITDIQRSHELLSSDDKDEDMLQRLEQKLAKGNVVALGSVNLTFSSH